MLSATSDPVERGRGLPDQYMVLVPHWAEHSTEKRRGERERIHARVVHPIDTPRQIRDPLVRQGSRVASTLTVVRLSIAALIVHACVLVVFAAVSSIAGEPSVYKKPERLKVRIVETPPPPPEVIQQPEPEPGPIAPDFEPPPPPKPATRPKTVKPQTTPPPPQAESTPADATPPKARRIVGLSLESTVEGTGPSFAAGHSRRGKTDTRPKPSDSAPSAKAGSGLMGPSGQATSEQRVASRIPTRDVQFKKPQRVRPSKPAYPKTLRAQGLEGDVLIRVSLDARGQVTGATILRSSGHPAFDKAARKAAQSERFTPAKRGNTAVPFTITYTYRFRLD